MSIYIIITILIGAVTQVAVFKFNKHKAWKASHWLDHSMKLGNDYYRVRHILRLGKKYNQLDFWNFFNPFTDDENYTMYRIRKLIEKYSLTL